MVCDRAVCNGGGGVRDGRRSGGLAFNNDIVTLCDASDSGFYRRDTTQIIGCNGFVSFVRDIDFNRYSDWGVGKFGVGEKIFVVS